MLIACLVVEIIERWFCFYSGEPLWPCIKANVAETSMSIYYTMHIKSTVKVTSEWLLMWEWWTKKKQKVLANAQRQTNCLASSSPHSSSFCSMWTLHLPFFFSSWWRTWLCLSLCFGEYRFVVPLNSLTWLASVKGYYRLLMLARTLRLQ